MSFKLKRFDIINFHNFFFTLFSAGNDHSGLAPSKRKPKQKVKESILNSHPFIKCKTMYGVHFCHCTLEKWDPQI